MWVLPDQGDHVPHVADAVLLLGSLHVLVEVLAVGPHIHVEDGRLDLSYMLPGDDRLLGGVHAADRGAVSPPTGCIPRAHALDEGDAGGDVAIRRALHPPLEGAGSGQDALELDAGHHVGVAPVAILTLQPSIELLETRGQDDGSHAELLRLLMVVVPDGIGQAQVLAQPAADALFPVNGEGQRHGLGVPDVHRCALAQPLVEDIHGAHRAGTSAHPAAGAPLQVNVPRLLLYLDGEVTHLAGDPRHLGAGHDLDVQMPPALHQLGGQDAHRAVVGGEGLVQLGHHPADGGRRLHQVDLEAGFGQVERGLDAADPPPDDHH